MAERMSEQGDADRRAARALCARALRAWRSLWRRSPPRLPRRPRRSNPSRPRPPTPRPAATPTSRPPSPSTTPGSPRPPRTSIFNAPEGVFGNPNAITHCTSSDFALDQCPSNSQAGLITVYANYEGNSDYLLGTAPIFDLEPAAEQTALFAFIVPDPRHPDQHPGRGPHRRRLRPALHRLRTSPRSTPLAGADLTFWGFPADDQPRRPTLPERRSRATRPDCAGRRRHQLPRARRPPASIPVQPADRQPDHLHRRTADRRPSKSRPTRTPTNLSRSRASYPPIDRLRPRGLQPGPLRQPDDQRDRLALGPQHRARAPPSSSASPPRPRRSNRRPSPCRRRPHDQPRRRRRPDAPAPTPQANFGTEAPAALPRQLEDRHLRDRHPGPGRAARQAPSTSANRSPATSTASS